MTPPRRNGASSIPPVGATVRWPRTASGRVGLAVAVAATALWAPADDGPSAKEKTPRLVLAVSVDQMRADYLDRFAPLFEGGFQRLREQGAVFTQARFRHANTETGPGHSVLLTGRLPRHSGIVLNEWWDPVLRRVVNVVHDPVHRPVGGPGRGASPAHLIGFTVGDALKAASPDSRVVGVSLKDRSAVLMAGRRGDAAYWYTSDGRFISSTYYVDALPDWLTAFNARRFADRLAGASWQRLLPDEAPYLRHAGPDPVDGEWDRVDTVFPHRVRGTPPSEEFYDDFRRTPMADEMTLEVALLALRHHALGTRGVTDLLAVGFSATDVIGHTYGPDSQEVMDQILRLDRLVGRLLEAADAQVVPGRTVVVLSADHGVQPLVEVLKARGLAGRRVTPEELERPVAEALAQRFGKEAPSLVVAADPPHFWLDLEAIESRGLDRSRVEGAVREALAATGVVEATYTEAHLTSPPPAQDPYFVLHRNAFFMGRSPQITGRMKRGHYVSDRPGGTGHGTPHDEDRHVPVVFMGPGVKPGRYDEPCGPEDIAWSLARLMGLDFPQQDAERLLSEMFR